jgi:glycerophosphoryl diester phosphodiesterase
VLNSPTGRPWIIAHRGASRDCPENTLAAFDEALRQGADGIELDVQFTRDEVPVVYHDKTLTRAGGGRRRVAGLSFRELRELDAAARFEGRTRRQRIPSLEEVLARYGRKTLLLVEIKTREGLTGHKRHIQLAQATASLLEQMRLEQRTLLLSFSPQVLGACAETAPRVGRVLNLRPPRRLTAALSRRLPDLFALCADIRMLTPAFARALHRAKRPLLTYTCNTKMAVERALNAGAAGVISDRPGWLAETVRSVHAT